MFHALASFNIEPLGQMKQEGYVTVLIAHRGHVFRIVEISHSGVLSIATRLPVILSLAYVSLFSYSHLGRM